MEFAFGRSSLYREGKNWQNPTKTGKKQSTVLPVGHVAESGAHLPLVWVVIS